MRKSIITSRPEINATCILRTNKVPLVSELHSFGVLHVDFYEKCARCRGVIFNFASALGKGAQRVIVGPLVGINSELAVRVC